MKIQKKKAKFSVGQVVAYRPQGSFGHWRFERVRQIRHFDGEGYGYHFDGFYEDATWKEEEKLRPLTQREIGPRPRPQPTKRGR